MRDAKKKICFWSKPNELKYFQPPASVILLVGVSWFLPIMGCHQGTSWLHVARHLVSSSSSFSNCLAPPSPSSFSQPSSSFFSLSSFVLMLKKLVATDGYRRDQCHELLEVALGVAIGVQALHHAVQCRLVFDVLRWGGQRQRSPVRSGHNDIKLTRLLLQEWNQTNTVQSLIRVSRLEIHCVTVPAASSLVNGVFVEMAAGMSPPRPSVSHPQQVGQLVVQ